MINSNLVVNDLYSDINKFLDESISKLNDIIYDALQNDLYNETDCEVREYCILLFYCLFGGFSHILYENS